MTKIAFLMDPIASVSVKKDSTLAMIAAAQKRDMEVFYLQQEDLLLDKGQVTALTKPLRLADDFCQSLDAGQAGEGWYELGAEQSMALADIDIVMMRKHILSMERLDALVSRVAADVNQDRSIDVLDIVAMRKVILGMRNDYAMEGSPQPAANWRLLDARISELPDQASLEEVQVYEGRSVNGMNADFLNIDWLAVKLGDVNGDWQP